MTKRKWTVTAFGLTLIVAVASLGFAAMSVNPPYTTPKWLPWALFVLTGTLIIALISYLFFWGVFKVQSPFIKISSITPPIAHTIQKQKAKFLKHDNVLWEVKIAAFGPYAIGPLCPKDYTPLSYRFHENIDPLVSATSYVTSEKPLICLHCKKEYLLSDPHKGKVVGDSKEEVEVLFKGMLTRQTQSEQL